jgi:Cu/Ag efflux protein CusF
MKKILAIALIFMMLAAAFSGCTKPAVQPEPAAPTPAPTTAPEQSNPPSPAPSAKIAAKGTDMQGKLNGWIDNNSVEIEINPEDTLAFRVTDVLGQLEGISDGDIVKFSYESNEYGQLNITKIEKMK